MKKAILFIAALVLLSFITNANEPDKTPFKSKRSSASDGTCFDENTHLINLGVGFGGGTYYGRGLGNGYAYSSSPAFSITYEQPYKKKLGPGFLGIGAYLGYKTASSRYDNYYYQNNRYYYEHRWNYFMCAGRAVYHWDGLNAKNAEVYGGVLAGFRVNTYNYNSNSPDPNKDSYKLNNSSFYPVVSLFAGARWYFVPNVALFSEIGYGVSFLTGGVTFKW